MEPLDPLDASVALGAAAAAEGNKHKAISGSGNQPVDSTANRNAKTGKRYTKLTEAADMAGELFEIKMLALIFLRLVGAGAEFAIASNMVAAGMFDDIVVKSRKSPQDPWKTSLLQLKHKKNANPISRSSLLSLQGDFSLVKYCDSYLKIKSGNNDELEFFGNVDDYRFIIFTTLGFGDKKGKNGEVEELFKTSGHSVTLAGDDDILNELCEWKDLKDALFELSVLIADKTEQESVTLIQDKINSLGPFKNKPVNSSKDCLSESPSLQKFEELLQKLELIKDRDIYTEFLGKLQFYTKQTNETNLDALIKEELSRVWTSNVADADLLFHAFLESVKVWWRGDSVYLEPNSHFWQDLIKTQIDKLSRISVLEGFGIDFEESHLEDLFRKLTPSGVMIVSVDSLTTVTAIKVMRAFARLGDGGNVLHVDLATLLEREDEVLAAWSSRWCDRLVIECSSDLNEQQVSQLAEKITKAVSNNGSKLALLVAKKRHGLAYELAAPDYWALMKVDKSEWNNLTKQSQVILLKTSINLQGAQIVLSDLVDDRFLSEMNLEVMSCLLQKDLICGKSFEKVGEFFLDRRLKKSEVTMNVNSLNDVPDKVVILEGEPGMGKSTLMHQLARSAKQVGRYNWTLQIRLCDYTELLQAVSSETLSLEEAWEFLGQFAFDTGHCLEKTLFKYWKHDVCVFVDGVDEVCPHYEKQVLALLKCFKEMDFKHLWVASRPICVSKLETVLGVIKFDLVQFSEQDQACCITSIWKKLLPENSQAVLEENTIHLLDALKKIMGEDNPILGVPLMTIMIAETFQNFETASTKTNLYSGGLFLYKSFVKKKFDIYYDEKKRAKNRQLPANLADEEKNRLLFTNNHEVASLSVLFNSDEIAALTFEGKDKFGETLASFCTEISEGRERTGVIDNIDAAGKPHFVHRSFAEFFVATWLFKHHAANLEFTKRIMFNAEFKLISDMFNSFFTNGHPLNLAVTNRNRAAIEQLLPEILANKVDEGGRSALHLAVFFSATTHDPEYFDLVKYFLSLKVRTDLPDRVLGWRPWQYAEHAEAWPLVGLLLAKADVEGMAYVEANTELSMRFFYAYLSQESEAPPDASLLLSVAKNAVVPVVRFLVEERGGDVFCRGPLGESMLHRAAEGGNIDVMAYLTNQGVPLFTEDTDHATPMHYAVRQGQYQAVEYLAEHYRLFFLGHTLLETSNFHSILSTAITRIGGEYIVKIAEFLLSLKAIDGDTPLHVACREGIAEVVSFLLQNGAHLEAVNDLGQTSLHLACEKDHVEVVKLLVEEGASMVDEEGDFTTLHTAAREGKADVVAYLLGKVDDINVMTYAGETALYLASNNGHLNVVKLLVEEGASMVGKVFGSTLLHAAVRGGKADVVAFLIGKVDDIDVETYWGETALYLASHHGHLDVVKLLVEKGASMVGDFRGHTPFAAAACEGKADVVAYLIGKVEDIDVKTRKGETALYLASFHGHLHVVKLLVEKGASMVGNVRGCTPFAAASQEGKADVVAYLIGKVNDINVETRKGETALYLASFHDHLDVVKLLFEKGASMVGNVRGCTPFAAAACEGKAVVVAYLIGKVEDIDVKTRKGETALYLASFHGHLHVVKLLVEKGASMVGNVRGCTPFAAASQEGKADVVAYLIEKVEDINVKTYWGETALALATSANRNEVIEILIKGGAKQ